VVYFQEKLWLMGGRSDVFQSYNMRYVDRNADVFYSADGGKEWSQLSGLTGDFSVGNADAKPAAATAPWRARFAHQVLRLPASCGSQAAQRDAQERDNATATTGVLVLAGGLAPEPNREVWISPDASTTRTASLCCTARTH
jgi:hypothetical protein